jgi:ribosomal protein S18 acetylase RimI-like enzyme
MRPDRAILERIEAQLLRGLATGSEAHETAAFRVFLWAHGDVFYRNRAAPVRRIPEWQNAIAEMSSVFTRAGRVPRLEFLQERWPDLAPALEHAGFRLEMEAPVMALVPAAEDDQPVPDIRLLDHGTSFHLIGRLLARAEAAFGMPGREQDPREISQMAREIASGTTMTAACVLEGEPVAAASLIGVGPEAELAGVWTDPEHRRRGLAHAVCRRLLTSYASRGGELVWLSAGDDKSERLYRRLGFVPMATQLNYART